MVWRSQMLEMVCTGDEKLDAHINTVVVHEAMSGMLFEEFDKELHEISQEEYIAKIEELRAYFSANQVAVSNCGKFLLVIPDA